ncbi:hypothetical protein KC19_11G062300 [Ceratodon purpureus]|uniref:TF-B3 domain-containing protein n=1 Tax=Ceratodon purpureus TaxID=3225 RepID=A0A8T0GDZ0_CERPU|nr:hypothetical protein KC19_11G062300 [Ceratodon purpureus]
MVQGRSEQVPRPAAAETDPETESERDPLEAVLIESESEIDPLEAVLIESESEIDQSEGEYQSEPEAEYQSGPEADLPEEPVIGVQRRLTAPVGSGFGSGNQKKYLGKPFIKTINDKNMSHKTARGYHCELCIPRRWAMANGFTAETLDVYLTSKKLEEQWMSLTCRKLTEKHPSWLIRHGWREFSEKHDIEVGWKLKFTPHSIHGANHLRVQRVVIDENSGTRKVVELR